MYLRNSHQFALHDCSNKCRKPIRIFCLLDDLLVHIPTYEELKRNITIEIHKYKI